MFTYQTKIKLHDTDAAGVIFFNNVGTIGMCGHGTIGLAVTLAHLGRMKPGEHRIVFEKRMGWKFTAEDRRVFLISVANGARRGS